MMKLEMTMRKSSDYSFLPDQDFDWTYSVYGDVHEILPDDMPEPLGKAVVTTTTMDANLNHCLATGKSVTDCYSKKQATVETARYWFRVCCCKNSNRADHGHQGCYHFHLSWDHVGP